MGDAPTEATASNASSKPKAPPGMVIGPDGKPCKVCSSSASFRNWKPTTKNTKSTSNNATSATLAGAGVTAAALAASEITRKDCPADVEELGRATWTFLHTAAAYYPTSPTPGHKTHMFNLLSALPTLYPCGVCADHLKEEVKRFPPDVSGREGLSRWLCERHNEVNERLGKEKFDCGIKNLDGRWKDGPSDGRCE
jgi:FAD-linked sulfhydryl oxidase